MLRAMRTTFYGTVALLAVTGAVTLGGLTASCNGTGATGGGGSTTATGGQGGSVDVSPRAGEVCTDATENAAHLQVTFRPSKVFLPPCATGADCTTRKVKVFVDPDTCWRSKVDFTSDNPAVAPAPDAAEVWLHHDVLEIPITAGAQTGKVTITATAHIESDPKKKKPSTPITGTLEVEVLPEGYGCAVSATAQGMVTPGAAPLALSGDDAAATMGLPKGADTPNYNSFLWSVPAFDGSVACAPDLALAGHRALGPAVTFGPVDRRFPREIPLSVPINPARFPSAARLRHLRVAYSGPSFKAPRAVPVTDARVTQVNGQWALSFMAPLLGTYQAFVADDAGTQVRKRKLTYRGVTGVSMGGGGTATFGMRHHDQFDVMAPLGGPVDWTWLLHYIENNHLGGFRPIPHGTTLKDIQLAATPCQTNADCQADETCVGEQGNPPGKCRLLPKTNDVYAHPSTFNTWWYEYPRAGNGGSFSRRDYSQIFRDLALMYGNPNGDNFAENGENLPAGVPPDHGSVVGDHPNRECAVTVDPLDCADGSDTCPEKVKQQELDQNCPKERCSHTLSLSNYYDDEYNPDGIFPVITVCDGSPQNQSMTPYANTWSASGDDYPLEVGLAVDYNGNGVRDEMEPIIRAGHEPWDDTGADGLMSKDEPGYSVDNRDPNGDDYDPQYNPTGTEGDHRYQQGEPFQDVGLDGVPNTPQQPADGWKKPGDGYDVGEGDGKFTVTRGLQRFWDRDAHSIARRMVDPAQVPGGDLTDDRLSRLDVWTDGGLRDLFNFGVDAQHLVGAFAARGRYATYLSGFGATPGLDPANPNYDPKLVDYDELPGIVLQRYGHIDPSSTDIDQGSGQHVGTGSEVASRLEAAIFFITSRWRNKPELTMRVETGPDTSVDGCKEGSETITFPAVGQPLGPSGRRGLAGISYPPGYCHKSLQDVRYPVIYLLHGYGQGPEDLEATIVLLQNWMNDSLYSGARRLPKALIVYVDGRCRADAAGNAECIRGTFFADSPRKTGAHDDAWWLELMDHVNKSYRTLPGETIDWVE
jgi:hypothetical protein